MFDVERWIIDLDKDRIVVCRAFVNWVVRIVERIPEPARKYIPLKTEHPANYESVEPGQFD